MRKRYTTKNMLEMLDWFLNNEERQKGLKVVTNMAYVYLNGGKYFSPQHHCHINMAAGARRDCEYSYAITGLNKSELTTKEELQCVDFLINRSFFKRAFIGNSAKRVQKYRGFLVDTRVYYNYMCAAVIATRFIFERKSCVARTWLQLVKHGVDENAAFILAHTVQWSKGDPKFYVDFKSNHVSIQGSNSFEHHRRALNYLNTDACVMKPSYNDNHKYDDIHGFHGNVPGPHKPGQCLSGNLLFQYAKNANQKENPPLFPINNTFYREQIQEHGNNISFTIDQMKNIANELLKGVNYDWQ